VDYSLLEDIPTMHREADHRYVAAPMVLLYVRASRHLVPLAIQLKPHNPDYPTAGEDEDNPAPVIWTPHDRPENWILAKLWVQNADFHWMFAISHLFRLVWEALFSLCFSTF